MKLFSVLSYIKNIIIINIINGPSLPVILNLPVGCCGVVHSTLAFGSIGHGFESELCSFSHHGTSAFCKLRSLAQC